MKHFLRLLAVCACLLSPHVSRAQVLLGREVASFPLTVSKLVSDPVRSRVYAAETVTNSVVIIDTTTLAVAATIPVGSHPLDMAMSLDGSTLYVANQGSTLAAISVIDLDSLAVTTTFALPTSPQAVACDPAGRVYVETNGSFQRPTYQLDGITGAVLSTFNIIDAAGNGLLAVSPDGTTLFAGSIGGDAASFSSFNLSPPVPTLLQTNDDAGYTIYQLVVSHNGKYVCLPGGGGNIGGPEGYATALFSTANITQYYGFFDNGDYPGALAFSPDDSLVYQTIGQADTLQVFNTGNFTKINEVPLTPIPTAGYPSTANTLVADNTGSYLFLGETAYDNPDYMGLVTVGRLSVLGTGAGTLTPPLPTISVAATVPSVAAGTGDAGAITITRTGDLSQALVVTFALKGGAKNGTDYQYLKLQQKIRPNKASATIHIVPQGTPPTAITKTVTLKLQPSTDYQLGTTTKAKVKISFGGISNPNPL